MSAALEHQPATVVADRTDILTLHNETSSHSPLTLRSDVAAHLLDTPPTTPGKQDVDQPWSFKRKLPTVLLYDDYGLEVYDRITGVSEYYPWAAEVEILKKDAASIARRVFGPYGKKGQNDGGEENEGEQSHKDGIPRDGHSRLKEQQQKWGDYAVGVNNQGVNGALGIADKRDAQLSSGIAENGTSSSPQVTPAGSNPNSLKQDRRGVIVELGAGSLKKTSLLLRAVAGLLGSDAGRSEDASQAQAVYRPTPNLEEVSYYALDLEYKQLASTLDALVAQHGDVVSPPNPTPSTYPKIIARGLCASYDDAVPFFHSGALEPSPSRKVILWLGSSLGNFSRAGAASFLRNFAAGALDTQAGDTMLIGIDGCHYKPMVESAYNDGEGVTRDFILNAVSRAREVLGLKAEPASAGDVNSEDWSADAFEYADRWNAGLGRHEAYLRTNRRVVLNVPAANAEEKAVSVDLEKGELIAIERSYKYAPGDVADLFERARVRPVQKWMDRSFGSTYGLWAVEKPSVWFEGLVDDGTGNGRRVIDVIEKTEGENGETEGSPAGKTKEEKNAFGVPTLEEWQGLWDAWDAVTLHMIPRDMLHQKPIDLRHICLFYLGHIPAFRDIHLARLEARLAGEEAKCAWRDHLTPPNNYADIFERGIDPNMDDPSQCHDHSEVPQTEDDWPKLAEVVDYATRVRDRVKALYKSHVEDASKLTRKVARVLSMVYEHEALHLETLLYMLQQAEPGRILPAPGFAVPDWDSLAATWEREIQLDGPVRRAGTVEFEATTIEVGHSDIEAEDDGSDGQSPFYKGETTGWDNESPRRKVEVGRFKVDILSITNAEYATFLKATGNEKDLVPSSWLPAATAVNGITNGVHSNGLQSNGVDSSSSRTSSPSSRPGSRQPSLTRGADAPFDVRVIPSPGRVPMHVAAHWPVQASGTQLARFAKWKGGRLPTSDELRRFYASEHAAPLGANGAGGNVGFRNWHPIPPMLGHTKRDGTSTGATNGGVWEWTSSDFAPHEGFVPSKLYPGYSADFHDGCHSIVLGGSWATVPRIAARVNAFTNWYQTNYPYVFAGGRVAYDA